MNPRTSIPRALSLAAVALVGFVTATAAAASPAATAPASLMVAIPSDTLVTSAAAAVAPFELDATEVTVDAYAACVRAGACSAPDSFTAASTYEPKALCNWRHPEGRGSHPINCVDWQQATTYCAWVGKRLPSDAEWEHAATRSGRYPWGDEEPDATKLNACGPECGTTAATKGLMGAKRAAWGADRFGETAPVGSYPNGDSPDDVQDLAGNVWEWTTGAVGGGRSVRGGSFYSVTAASVEGASRSSAPASQRSFAVGFRCAR